METQESKKTNIFGHRYEELSCDEGYGICSGCGCRENTEGSASHCTGIASKITEDIFNCAGTKATRIALKAGTWAQETEVDLGGLGFESLERVVAESIYRNT